MPFRGSIAGIPLGVGLLLAVFYLKTSGATGQRVALGGSIRKVPPTPAGAADVRRAYVSRATLLPAEAAEERTFEVALKMRDLPGLQARVAHGGTVSRREMAAKYYPAEADYDAVAAWLTSEGFTILRRDDSHLAVFARGQVSQIQQALQTTFARVTLEGREYSSAITAPTVPAELLPLIVGINGLQPHLHPHRHLLRRQAVANSLTDTNPPYTPGQIETAYNASGLYSANISGSAQAIAIVIDTFPNNSDLTLFWKQCGINQSLNNIQEIQVVAGKLPGLSGEETLDSEWSSSIAPSAHVRIYATTALDSTYLDIAYQQIYTDVLTHPEYGIHQMTMSYGIRETDTTSGQVQTDAQYFAALASAGVTVFASSGDGGSTPGPGGPGDNSGTVAQVESPSSDQSVTGVGGTSVTLTSGATVSSESAWSLGGGGTSIYFSRPTWQTGAGVSGSNREVPNVSLPADPNTGAFLVISGTQTELGGTSWSSPTWAGFCALINQARANVNLPPAGLLGPRIYPLLGTSSFRDITAGSNGFPATAGFDRATGIGVPNVQPLAQTLVGLQTTPQAATFAPGSNATFTVALSGSAAGFQWQRIPIGSGSAANLSDGGPYSGTATASITISGVTLAMSGDQFQCVVNTGTSVVTTAPPSVLVVDTPLTILTLAGQPLNSGTADGAGAAAQFSYPSGAAVDSFGNVYIADYNSDTIRKVTPAGAVTTPYGRAGVAGSTNGSGANALFNTPNAVAVDGSNNLYVADSGNDTIRKITLSGTVSTLAGRAGHVGSANGSISQARFNNPQGVAVDATGNVYVADSGNNTIRKIAIVSGTVAVSTLAGNASSVGYLDSTGTQALFNTPISVAVDTTGNVYVADLGNDVVREITPAKVVSTPYGEEGTAGRIDGIGNQARFNSPVGLALDGSNNLYVTDSQVPPTVGSTISGNNLLRRITPAGVVSTIAGQAGVTGTNDGTGMAAQFYSLQAVAVDSNSGAVYLADTFNQTVRVAGAAPAITAQPAPQMVTAGQSVTFTVADSGTGPYTYQWYKDSVAIPGATGASYTIPNVMSGDAGSYYVVITNPYGSVTSNPVMLTVSPAVPALPPWAFVALPILLLAAAARFLRRERQYD